MTGSIIFRLTCNHDTIYSNYAGVGISFALTTHDERRYDAVKERKRKFKILSYLFCKINNRTENLSISVSNYIDYMNMNMNVKSICRHAHMHM